MAKPIAIASDFVALLGTSRNATGFGISEVIPMARSPNTACEIVRMMQGVFSSTTFSKPPMCGSKWTLPTCPTWCTGAGASISNEVVDFQVFQAGEWSSIRSVMAYSAQANTTRPVVFMSQSW